MIDKIGDKRAAERLMEELAPHLTKIEAACIENWRAAKTYEMREECHKYMLVLDRLRDDLRSIVCTGEIEERKLEEVEQQEKGRKPWVQ